jgi:hypothetical protein
LTCVEKGLDAWTEEEVVESAFERIFEAGRRTSLASYGQLRDTVVVKGMKNVSKGMKG